MTCPYCLRPVTIHDLRGTPMLGAHDCPYSATPLAQCPSATPVRCPPSAGVEGTDGHLPPQYEDLRQRHSHHDHVGGSR